MRVQATTSVARASGNNPRSTCWAARPRTVCFACATAFATACGGAPEKVVHPEPQPTAAPAATPAPVAETPPPKPSPAPPPSSPAPVSPPSSAYQPAVTCDVRGTPVMTKGANLWGEPQGTNAVANFAGQPIGIIASGFPASASAGRIRVRTSGGIRIDGFVDANELAFYTASELAVVQ